ncbi:ImmA/IrrE family metallo-endopeptidase [Thermodesulfobacteriota bacterium]
MAFIQTPQKKRKKIEPSLDDRFTEPDFLLEYAQEKGIDVNPLDVVALAHSLDIKLRFEPLRNDASGLLKKDEEDNWYMHINSLHHPNRQRFTIAHELAHRFLDGKDQSEFTDTIFFRNGELSPMEAAANNYAACLLMPQEKFKHFVTNVSSKVEDIAMHFGVSSLAVRYRAKKLGYTGHGV